MKNNASTRLSADTQSFHIGDRVLVTGSAFVGHSGVITCFPSVSAAIVDLDKCGRERIATKHLQIDVTEQPMPSEKNVARATWLEPEIISGENVARATSLEREIIEPEITSEPNSKNVARATWLEPEIISEMTEQETLLAIEEINKCAMRVRQLLLEIYLKKGYLALGFKNMTGLMRSNFFSKARETLQLELQAGRIEKEHLNVPVGTFCGKHLRPLSKLKPEYYKAAVDKAEELAGDRLLRSQDVRDAVLQMLQSSPDVAKRSIVDQIKERNFIPLNEREDCKKLQVVKIKSASNPELRPVCGYWGLVNQVLPYSFQVYIGVKDQVLHCKEEEVERLDMNDRAAASLIEVSGRIKALLKFELEPVDYAVLETMQRSVSLTQRQKLYLERIEKDYGIDN